ncbi:hypothetical protein [Stieleria mannarensis]|uniref:hypothetical protein n=1 Tax=Stieleria mannarensis TaxID=2755585 RepID=UPI001600F749|nr:hypothetical protein [Rhodopirellula sp. JC639]
MRWEFAVALLSWCLVSPHVHADDDNVIQFWLDVAEETADKQTISLLDDQQQVFELHKPAVFRHTQPIRGDDIGSMFVWKTTTGRPVAIGVFFSWSQGRHRWVMEEFHSLHDQGIQKQMPDHVTWRCPKPGLDWAPFPDAPPAVGSTSRKRLQAKQLANQVEAYTEKTPGERVVLRAVPKPIYEYEDVEAGVVFGAIMAFCQGTDTELLLLVEARKQGDNVAWHYAPASFTDYGLNLQLPDGTRWTSRKGQIRENGQPHYWNFVEQRAKPDFEK